MRQDDCYKLVAVISQYGWHGSRHAANMLHYMEDQYMWQEYTATVLWSIGKVLSRDYPIPSYDDFKHPKPVDKRTTKDIVDGLIDKLSKGGEIAE